MSDPPGFCPFGQPAELNVVLGTYPVFRLGNGTPSAAQPSPHAREMDDALGVYLAATMRKWAFDWVLRRGSRGR